MRIARCYIKEYLLFVTLILSCTFYSYGQTLPIYRNEKAPLNDRVLDLLNQLNPEEKISLLIASSPGIPRLAIDKYYHGNEALHGVVRPGKFTVFPQAIAMASMWNPELLFNVATAISDEARARWNELDGGKKQTLQFNDLLSFWSPTINMARDPRWGRTPETYGEDPFLSGVLGVQFVKGLQGNDPKYLKVVATPKHFAVYNQEGNRYANNPTVSMRLLREYYLPAFEACIKEGKAASIMSAYNWINGIPCTANTFLLTKVLREDWNFKGYVVSDCGAVTHLMDGVGGQYVKTKELAAMVALKAGLDLECGDDVYKQPLINAYKLGMVSIADIDTAAYRILKVRMQLGLFDDPSLNPYNNLSPAVIGSAKHKALALEAAKESIVLLKNDRHLLPINIKKIKSIAVVGIDANNNEFGDYSGMPVTVPVSILQGIKNKLGDKLTINYAPWKPVNGLEGYTLISKEYFPRGLNTTYYSTIKLEGDAKKRMEEIIDFDPTNHPPDAFPPSTPLSIKWEGKLRPTVTGKYSFGFFARDGARLSINHKMLIDSWRRKSLKSDFAEIDLEAGKEYEINAAYFNYRKPATAKLLWKVPNESKSYTDLFADAIACAKKSTITIAVLGINALFEREGQDGESIKLSKDQEAFIQEIVKANPSTVVVLVDGGSLAIGWINKNIPAIIDSWYSGQEGGTAVADVLFGDYNPAGRLPLTFYNGLEDLPSFSDYDITKGRTYQYFKGKPLYPFGFGLSYTNFFYSDLHLIQTDTTVNVRFAIKNTGKNNGDEVAQVYVKLPDMSIPIPIKQLKGFKRLQINSGIVKTVDIVINKAQLRYWDEKESKFVTPKGDYTIMVGSSSADIRLSENITIQ
jgi:beta-glucosidase